MSEVNPRTLASIAAEAADWFVELRGSDIVAARRERFAEWLSASPLHVREYLGVAEAWGALSCSTQWTAASVDELIAAARNSTNVARLADRHQLPMAANRFAARRLSRWSAVAAVVLVTTIALAAWLNSAVFSSPAVRYASGLGEQRYIVLPDGSSARLNTLSELAVRFDDGERRIELLKGEAFFTVVHDRQRPFRVTTATASVLAVGTQFNVYSHDDTTEVAVTQGRVLVSRASTAGESRSAGPAGRSPAVDLVAGQIVIVTPQILSPPAPASVDALTAWMQRRLAFENRRLVDVAEQFNRYNARKIEITDPRLRELRISGVFNADDPGALVRSLQKLHGARVTSDEHTTYVAAPAQ